MQSQSNLTAKHMKTSYHKIIAFAIIFLVIGHVRGYALSWTETELRAANTAATCSHLSQVEKDVILYTNLARMYPAKFAALELSEEKKTSYVNSLVNTLNTMKSVAPLAVNRRMVDYARCWADESGIRGIIGHDRINCDDLKGYAGENCSYGVEDARGIVLQLLIDEGIPSLGHRENCLNANYKSVGVAFAEHTAYRFCCVMDFTSDSGMTYPPAKQQTQTTQVTPQPQQQQENAQDGKQKDKEKKGKEKAEKTIKEPSAYLTNFYDYSGKHAINVFSVGYTYSCIDNSHLINASLLDFRTTLFGASLLNTELSVSPFNKRFSYKPQVRVYVPIVKCLSVVPYGGAEIDASYLGKYLDKNYSYDPKNDFYVNVIGGVALNLSAAKHVPMEIKVEYRHPVVSSTSVAPNSGGFYVGAQIYFSKIYGNK